MPSVTVKLIHTPRPEGDVVDVPLAPEPDFTEGVYLGEDGWVAGLTAFPDSVSPAEALTLADALVLVAGCADTRWRGWHWEAREANGQLLATTPVGEWYVNREDCERAVITLFGDRSEVVAQTHHPKIANPSWLLRQPAEHPVSPSRDTDAVLIDDDRDRPTIKPELIVHGDGGLTKRCIDTIHKLSKWAGVDVSELVEQGYLKEGDLDGEALRTPLPPVEPSPYAADTTPATPDADPEEYPGRVQG